VKVNAEIFLYYTHSHIVLVMQQRTIDEKIRTHMVLLISHSTVITISVISNNQPLENVCVLIFRCVMFKVGLMGFYVPIVETNY